MQRDARESECVTGHPGDFFGAPQRTAAARHQTPEPGRIFILKCRNIQGQFGEAAAPRASYEALNRFVQRIGALDTSHGPSVPKHNSNAATKPGSNASLRVSGGVSTNTSRRPPPVEVM